MHTKISYSAPIVYCVCYLVFYIVFLPLNCRVHSLYPCFTERLTCRLRSLFSAKFDHSSTHNFVTSLIGLDEHQYIFPHVSRLVSEVWDDTMREF